jgi:hypothetical protein
MDADLMFGLWPLFLCIGWAVFIFSFLIPEPIAVTIMRVAAFALMIVAAICAIPGIA